jgi:hypothetical protein
MFSILFPLFMTAAIVQAAPAPQASALPEIGRTRSTSVCQRIVENTTATIDSALRNDANIRREVIIFRFHDPRIFGNAVARANWEHLATHFATEMYNDLKATRARLDELRDIAAKLPPSDLKDETNAYVDALDKSQGDQSKISRRILASLILGDARTLAAAYAGGDANAMAGKAGEGTTVAKADDLPPPLDPVTAYRNRSGLAQAADLMESEARAIVATEDIAAPHAEKLRSACERPVPTAEPSPLEGPK